MEKEQEVEKKQDRKFHAEKLKKRRKELGLTQEQLASEIGVHTVTIGRWETGQREPKGELLFKLCNVLKVPVSYFFSSENKKIEKSVVLSDSFPDSLLSDPDFIIHFSAYQKFKSLPEGEQKEALRKVLESYVKAVEAAKKVEEGK